MSAPGSTSWDTADRRLAAWGVALDRRGSLWVVHVPVPGEEGTRELTLEGSPRTPPSVAIDLVRAFTRGERLRSLARAGPTPSVEPPLSVPAMEGRPRVGDVVTAALTASVRRYVEYEPFVRIGDDGEALHRSRVAVRRLHAYVRIFRRVLDRPWADDLRAELRWLIDVLGATRDLDVILAHVLEGATLVGARSRSTDAIVAAIGEARARSAAEMTAAFGSDRYATLLDRLVDAARSPAMTDQANVRGKKHLRPFVRDRWRKLRADHREAGSDPSQRQLHKLRIETKRVRYAADAVVPVFGEPAAAFAAAASDLQDALGDARDDVIAQAWLRGWASAGGPSRAAATRDPDRAVTRPGGTDERWRAAWSRLSDKRLRRWLRP